MHRTQRLPAGRQGFTLAELLVYTAIFAIVAGILTSIFYLIVTSQKKTSVSSEVSQQLNFVLTTVQRLVGDAALVESVYEGSSPSSPCTTFCTLKLRNTDPTKDPTIISSNASGIYLQEGSSAQTTLTTNKVLVNSLKFTKHEIPGGHAVVEISTSFAYNTTNPSFAVTRAIESAIARVNAATFDADLIPNQDNTFDVGQVSGSSLRWRNGRFSQDLTVGGQLTISGGSPGSGKVLTSDASGVGSWQVGGVGWAASSTNIYNTNSGNVGIGTTAPGSLLHLHKATNPYVRFSDEAASDAGDIAIGLRQDSGVSALEIFNYDGTGNLVTIKQNGNVGIGTTNPGYRLHAITTGTGGVKFETTDSYSDFYLDARAGDQSGALFSGDSSGNLLLQRVGGNVGIGKIPVTALDVNGTITGVVKNFAIPHPTKSGYTLVHSTLEGPEIAVFYRGEAQLKNGRAVVILPDYFEALTRKEGRTTLLTPLFERDSEPVSGLAVSTVVEGKFTVRAIDAHNPNQKFYWEVKATRADTSPLQIEKLNN